MMSLQSEMFKVIIRCLSTTTPRRKEAPTNLKGKSKSSQEWLIRQLKDPYVENARMKNYRCRSAFKLLEINDSYNILHPGHCVVDCGAAPGSWTQVSIDKTNATLKDKKAKQGFVIGIDILPLHPIEGAILLGNCDFRAESSRVKLHNVLKDRKVDVVLSDMAPNASGIKTLDHDSIVTLAYEFIRFGLLVSKTGGNMLLKLWEGGRITTLESDLKRFYTSVKRVKPAASRTDSSEIYILARQFKGVQMK